MEFLTVLGILLIIVGIIGCIIPGIAGPPFSFLALICLSIERNWEPFSAEFLVVFGTLTLAVQALDYLLPALGAKKFGSTRYGFWGTLIGMFLGIFFLPPLGMILGALIGAMVGETIAGKESASALKAAWGVFAGVLTGMVLKLILASVMTFYFFKALF